MLAQTRAHFTIKTYLAGVHHLHIHGFQIPRPDNPRLELALKGMQCIKPRQAQSHFFNHSSNSYPGLEKLDLLHFDKKMWAASLLAFFPFLRCSEFTISVVHSYETSNHLSLGDISIDRHDNPTVMAV